jgi:hypothetical protein
MRPCGGGGGCGGGAAAGDLRPKGGSSTLDAVSRRCTAPACLAALLAVKEKLSKFTDSNQSGPPPPQSLRTHARTDRSGAPPIVPRPKERTAGVHKGSWQGLEPSQQKRGCARPTHSLTCPTGQCGLLGMSTPTLPMCANKTHNNLESATIMQQKNRRDQTEGQVWAPEQAPLWGWAGCVCWGVRAFSTRVRTPPPK